jgi:hypothetical protein
MVDDSQFFPYRNCQAAEISRVLAGVRCMLYGLANDINEKLGLHAEDVDDVVNQCMEHLWQCSLPRFDTRRATKVSTYIHDCAARYLSRQLSRTKARGHRRTKHHAPEFELDTLHAQDRTCDARVERLALRVLANPEAYLSTQQAAVLRAVVSQPDRKLKDIAKDLGYELQSSLSMMLRKIASNLADLDVEELHD